MRGGLARLGLVAALWLAAGCSTDPGGQGDAGLCDPGDTACHACPSGNCPPVDGCPSERQCSGVCCDVGQRCDQGACVVDDTECIYIPGPGEFEAPELGWWWPFTDATGRKRRDIELPAFDQVMSTPVVVRIRGPNFPEDAPTVVFNTFQAGGSSVVEGVLRAIRGDTGEPLFTITDPALRVNGVSSPAVGDLDGDGLVEIVTGFFDGSATDETARKEAGLIAFRHDGTFLWRSDPVFVGWGGPAIADLDGDGFAEVVIGNTVLDGRTGKKRCSGGFTDMGHNGVGPLSAVADLDGDGKPEFMGGAMAYQFIVDDQGNATCRRFWPQRLKDANGNLLGDGFPAVGDIFDDPAIRTTQNAPEVVVVSGGTVRVHDWTGGIVMNPVTLPLNATHDPNGQPVKSNMGGPPTIADFDGDGLAEIGVASQSGYSVFKPGRPGNLLWTVQTQDFSSSTTGSSVFDFDGNGRAEVVYTDECYVHVFDGATGMEVFKVENTSCTAYEMPVVADVNGDGGADLLVPANNKCKITCPYGTHEQAKIYGLRLFRSPTDSWVASRPVWNQHTYHVTNVGDFGEIPAQEPRHWGPGTRNSFRQNYQGEGTFAAPNLRVSRVRLDGNQCPSNLVLFAEVENAGSRGVRAGLPVAFYEETSGGRVLLGVATVDRMLQPGESAEVSLEWSGPPRLNAAQVVAVADDDGTGTLDRGRHKECDESDNAATFTQVMCREAG